MQRQKRSTVILGMVFYSDEKPLLKKTVFDTNEKPRPRWQMGLTSKTENFNPLNHFALNQ